MSTHQKGRELFIRLAKGEPPSPIYLLYGEESFLVDEAVKSIVRAVLPDGGDDFSHQRFDGSEVPGVTIRQSLETLSLFGGRRLIHVRNIGAMPAGEAEALIPYLTRPADMTYLLMTDRSLDARKRFFKAVSGSDFAEVIEFKPLRTAQLPGWIERRAGQKGLKDIRGDLAHLVAELTGPDLASMDSALDKLSLYAAGGTARITEALIRSVLDDTRVRNIFELTRQLGECDLAGCMSTLEQMLDRGESPVGMVSMIARHFRIVWQVKHGRQQGLAGRELAQQAGCHPMFVQEYERDARRFSVARLSGIIEAIHHAERALKSSRLSDRLFLDELVLCVCLGNAEGL